MHYRDTGNFTGEQRAICKKIKQLINDGKRKGLLFKFVNNNLKDYGHPIKSLNCGLLNGKNTLEEYFEIGELEDDITEDIIGA